MTDILLQYGLFLAKAVTVVVAIGVVVGLVFVLSRRERAPERLDIKHLNSKYDTLAHLLEKETLSKKAFKKLIKEEKSRKKAEKKELERAESGHRKRIFVLNFHGDIKATGVASLREEITGILTLATPEDEVLVRLESAGGLVHEHGLAASQLARLGESKIPLTVAVDKIAASGGYMMACVADRIIAAPFAVLGSIGVLAQIPNFHRFLESHGIDFEQIKAGDFKRTITMFGKNTDEDRTKMREQVEDTHTLFKEFVVENRPSLDVSQVATGEHWYGSRALELKLVDRLQTSDDYLLDASRSAQLYEVSYTTRKSIPEKMASVVQLAAEKLLFSLWQREQESRVSA